MQEIAVILWEKQRNRKLEDRSRQVISGLDCWKWRSAYRYRVVQI